MDKILICGPRGVGKSTLIRRLAALYPGPVSGFVTKRLTTADGEGMFPIYIHPAAQPEDRRQYGPENLAGRCDSRRSARYTPVFDEWGPRLLAGPGLLVMDELGFLDGVNFQHGAVAENGVMDPRAGGKCIGQRCFVQKAAGKADIFPRLPDELLPRRAGEGEKLLVDVQQEPRGIPRAAVQIAALRFA